MELTVRNSKLFCENEGFFASVLFGCIVLVLSSCIKIKGIPISFTLQTFAIYSLALSLSPKENLAITFAYLLCATIGLPVFYDHANPLWLTGKSAGYLLAFPFAAYVIALMRQKRSPLSAVLCGVLIIFTLGFLRLIPLVGIKVAFIKGVLLFLPSELLKIIAALRLTKEGIHNDYNKNYNAYSECDYLYWACEKPDTRTLCRKYYQKN